ncbi:MAG TPA: phosphoglycerate mutase family protein [Blastocatellia bacterium]|nr:phosphoglycerate mutase family protein [Blastocatellia bacterium]
MRRLALIPIALFLVWCPGCNRTISNPTVVLVVRHAEKASDDADTPLSDAGMRRGQALARVAGDARVSAIYASQFKRTRDTAQPLAQQLGIPVTEMPVNLDNPGDYGKQLARDVLDKHAGQSVLVVSHRNTVSSIVEALAGKSPGEIQDVYSDLFIIVIPPGGSARLIKGQYAF